MDENIIILDESSIIEATDKGILYQTEDGTKALIEFSACYENHLKMWSDPERLEHVKKINNMEDERLARFITRIKQTKDVGKRNPLTLPWADGPYIEFFTEPPIRFRFTNNTGDGYKHILDVIYKAGWKTFDQS